MEREISADRSRKLFPCRGKILQLEVWGFKRELTVRFKREPYHKLKRTINRGDEIKDVEIE